MIKERYSHDWPSSRTSWGKWDGVIRWESWDDEVHILSGEGWRGWDRMIRWDVLKQLAKFTYLLETDEEGIGWGVFKQLINLTYILEGIIGWDIIKQLIKFTYILETDEDGIASSDNIQVIKFTYVLERMRWNNQMRRLKIIDILSGDEWKRWDGMMRWGYSIIDQVHVHSGYRWRGWYKMIRLEAFKQLTKLTYALEADEEDG
jgi:hypothetical protein